MDGDAWRCSIYKDGKKIGEAMNEGSGGPNLYYMGAEHRHADEAFTADAMKWLKANDGWWSDSLMGEYVESEDWFLGAIMDLADLLKRTKRALKTKLIIRLPDETMYHWKRSAQHDEKTRAHIAEKYPEAIILNDIAVEEAQPFLFTSEGA